jgi:PST family polysaccharide transporter
MMKILAITSFPVMAGAAAITEPLVHVVLGPKWVEAIPLMRLFALIGLVGSLNAVTGVTFLANGETRLIMNLGFVNQFVALIAIVVGSFWGAMGCTFGGAISALQVFVLNGNFVCRTLSLSRYAYYQQVVLPLPAAVLMGISTYGLTTLLHSQGSVVTLIVAVVFGGLLYPALLRVTDHIGWKELRRLAGELKSTVNAAQFLDRAGWIRQGA